ncbi:hypothetical protein [Shewanella nanhaiensis]|uniref:Uncharacterized protein n=1 Tax=Shewanella nanhaiensis TaxID=2864872 RepID=A0ABS7E8D8_9GAMM|nr:hypothetical protein [Shewanella nanhaiensis]MBW8185292.1 hypothetical protein [Shewanella nanhaiensis]
MSVLQAIGQQNIKAEFAHRLQGFLNKDPDVRQLFTGATSITTVANLLAALSFQEGDARFQSDTLDEELVFSLFFDSFYLLFIKELEHNNLSQAERLILQLSRYYGELMAKTLLQAESGEMAEELPTRAELLKRANCVLQAWEQLNKRYALQRGSLCNMGR